MSNVIEVFTSSLNKDAIALVINDNIIRLNISEATTLYDLLFDAIKDSNYFDEGDE